MQTLKVGYGIVLRVGLKTRLLKQFFIIFLVVAFTHTTTATGVSFPRDAEIDNARAEVAATKKELAAAQEILKKSKQFKAKAQEIILLQEKGKTIAELTKEIQVVNEQCDEYER